jgi:hypothetical protein
VTEQDRKSLITERADGRRGRLLTALQPSDPSVAAVMRLTAAALVVTFVLWMIR